MVIRTVIRINLGKCYDRKSVIKDLVRKSDDEFDYCSNQVLQIFETSKIVDKNQNTERRGLVIVHDFFDYAFKK